MYVIDRTGDLILNYRKHFLYTTDKDFCRAGKGFSTVDIKDRKGQVVKVGVGICMDINPKDFLDYSLYEIANFFLKEDIDFVGKV